MVLRFFILAGIFLFISCTQVERDNPYDPDGVNYIGEQRPNFEVVYGESVDYHGETYKTVVIGEQTWFQRNLNYAVDSSRCYSDKLTNCDKYGRLYNWVTAMVLPYNCSTESCSSLINAPHQGICPDGWHIPSDEDWDKLYRYADSTIGTSIRYNSRTAGRYLKATSEWNGCGYGSSYSYQCEDKYGFSALPGGVFYPFVLLTGAPLNEYKDAGIKGYWWTSNEYNVYTNTSAYNRVIYNEDENAYCESNNKKYFQSVRCLKD